MRCTTIQLLWVSYVKQNLHTHTHTPCNAGYMKVCIYNFVRSSRHGDGRHGFGMLSKTAIQTNLEALFVRTLRNALLAHDTRNRSIGWTKANICEHGGHRQILSSVMVLELTSDRISRGSSGNIESSPSLRHSPGHFPSASKSFFSTLRLRVHEP